MDLYTEEWQAVLIRNGWNDFERIWSLEQEWFEAPNYGRGGWSGICKATLMLADGSECPVFIKRQENFVTRTLLHPFRGIPTLRREMENVSRFQQAEVPTVDCIYYGERKTKRLYRSVMVTLALENYCDLNKLLQSWEEDGAPLRRHRNLVLLQIAILARRLHQNHLVHNCFYPKHIFIDMSKLKEGKKDSVRLIDLEKSKFKWLEKSCMLRDLTTLFRHLPSLPLTDLLRFMQFYRAEPMLTEGVKKDWRLLTKFLLKHQKKKEKVV